MPDVQTLLNQMREARQHWCDLPDGKKLRFLRPEECDLAEMRVMAVDDVVKYSTGWTGFTEADLLPEGVGGSSPVEFDSALWSAFVRDRAPYLTAAIDGFSGVIIEYLESKKRAKEMVSSE